MIYLDNAATTMHKPPAVLQAVADAMCSLGNSGRGAHKATLEASRSIYQTRKKLSDLFHAEGAQCIAFSANATESLNIAIKGILKPGDHVISTHMEHNSVLRPLYEMEERGVLLTLLSTDEKGRITPEQFEKAITKDTKAIVCTHASNLTGNVNDIEKIGQIARANQLLFIVDASQTAGSLPIDVQKMQIDVLCFTGHKALLGPQGTGGIYVRPGLEVQPLKSGGSGVQTFSRMHPKEMPTALEAGTLNGHGIAGLGAAVDYIQELGIEQIHEKEEDLATRFYQGIRDIPGICIYGDFSKEARLRCPIVSVNIKDEDSAVISDRLYTRYEIATRSGGHCAPLMHEDLGTRQQGAVRFSFSIFNTEEEIDRTIDALKELAKEV